MKLILCGLCVALFFASAGLQDANALFWCGFFRPPAAAPVYNPPCAPCGPAYRPVTPRTSFYAPWPTMGYSSIWGCGPACPIVCDPCMSGNCATGAGDCGVTVNSSPDVSMGEGSQEPELAPNQYEPDGQKTFAGENNSKKVPEPEPDSGFRPRKSGNDAANPGADPFNRPNEISPDNGMENRDAFKLPSVIEKPKPAPVVPPGEEARKKTSVPPMNLDAKITWRPTVRRTRLNIQADYVSPVVVRTNVTSQSDWPPATTPVQTEKIVRK